MADTACWATGAIEYSVSHCNQRRENLVNLCFGWLKAIARKDCAGVWNCRFGHYGLAEIIWCSYFTRGYKK